MRDLSDTSEAKFRGTAFSLFQVLVIQARSVSATLFSAAQPESFPVPAFVMQPGKFPYERFRKLNAIRIDFKTAGINLALSGNDIKVSARG
jgi:hypothetical protein